MTIDAAMDVLPAPAESVWRNAAPVVEELESAQEAFEDWIEHVCSDVEFCEGLIQSMDFALSD